MNPRWGTLTDSPAAFALSTFSFDGFAVGTSNPLPLAQHLCNFLSLSSAGPLTWRRPPYHRRRRHKRYYCRHRHHRRHQCRHYCRRCPSTATRGRRVAVGGDVVVGVGAVGGCAVDDGDAAAAAKRRRLLLRHPSLDPFSKDFARLLGTHTTRQAVCIFSLNQGTRHGARRWAVHRINVVVAVQRTTSNKRIICFHRNDEQCNHNGHLGGNHHHVYSIMSPIPWWCWLLRYTSLHYINSHRRMCRVKAFANNTHNTLYYVGIYILSLMEGKCVAHELQWDNYMLSPN